MNRGLLIRRSWDRSPPSPPANADKTSESAASVTAATTVRAHGAPYNDGTRWPRSTIPRGTPLKTDAERLIAYTDRSTGCWIWLASKDKDGYGLLRSGKAKRRAHIVAYELHVGPVQPGHELDHKCRNRGCCNPAHLEPVTHQVNVRRGALAWHSDHCARGHELTPDNIRHRKLGRQCLACYRATSSTRRPSIGAVAR